MPNDLQDWTVSFGQVVGEVAATDFKVTGLSGAAAVSRWVGTVSGAAPTSGTFAQGDYVVDESATSPGFWVCTVGGTPGTWVRSESIMPAQFRVNSDQNVTGAGIVQLNNPTAAHRALIEFLAASASKWSFGLDTTGDLIVRDNVNGLFPFDLAPNNGLLTLTGPVTIPRSAGGTSPSTAYGTLSTKTEEQSPGTNLITINVPTWARKVRIDLKLRTNSANTTDVLSMRFINDAGNNYEYESSIALAGGAQSNTGTTGTNVGLATIPGGGGGNTTLYANGWIEVFDPNLVVGSSRRGYQSMIGSNQGGSRGIQSISGEWTNTTTVIATIQLLASAGVFVGLVIAECSP